jgi:hypothetical protein
MDGRSVGRSVDDDGRSMSQSESSVGFFCVVDLQRGLVCVVFVLTIT